MLLNPLRARNMQSSGFIVKFNENVLSFTLFSFADWYRTRTKRIELKFSLKLRQMPLHQASSGELDTIRIRATPIRFRRFRPNRWRFSKFFRPDERRMRRWLRANSFEHRTISRINRIGSRIGTNPTVRAIYWWFSKFFRSDGLQIGYQWLYTCRGFNL